MQQKIVITGGPSTGKTTLINELESRKYICTPEISRQITQMARQKGIEQLFLEDPLLFSKMLLEGREQQFLDASKMKSSLIFFDRGIPDIHAYMDFSGTSYPDIYLQKSWQYRYDEIFLLPPWKEIYETDEERYESYDLSLAIYKHLKEAYAALDYPITEVPVGKVEDRAHFILKHLNLLK